MMTERGAQHVLGATRAVGPQPGRPCQPSQAGTVVGSGEQVCPAQTLQLDPVFEQPQETVGVAELGSVDSSDVPTSAKRGKGVHGGGDAQGLVGAAVHELK